MTGLSQRHINWLEHERAISAETASRYGLYSASKGAGGEIVPDAAGNVLAMPFFEDGTVVAEKYRGPGKEFWQRKGGAQTFWNNDALRDPSFETFRPLIICEGELDALSAIESGFPLAVSVPSGAPSAESDDGDIKPTGKFSFMWRNRHALARIPRFVLAVDGDEPGRRLQSELVRFLMASRCSFIEYPEGCKDLNEVLVKFGPQHVAMVLNTAKPFPVHGLYRLSDYPAAPDLKTYTTGWVGMDGHLQPALGQFWVVSGIPNHGKSLWTLNLAHNLAGMHNWPVAIFSPEMRTVPVLRNRLRRMRGKFGTAEACDAWIEERFVFMDGDPDRNGDAEEAFSMAWILKTATEAVWRYGIKVLVLDPWNEIEHTKEIGETTTEYVGRSIRQLKAFAYKHQVLVIVVAHPTKDVVGKDGKARTPTLYDIESSANWFNKCDVGIIIERPDFERTECNVSVQKVRFEECGRRGSVRMNFCRDEGIYRILG
jgi:twinkle protein